MLEVVLVRRAGHPFPGDGQVPHVRQDIVGTVYLEELMAIRLRCQRQRLEAILPDSVAPFPVDGL